MYQEPQVARTIHKYTLLGTRYYIDDTTTSMTLTDPNLHLCQTTACIMMYVSILLRATQVWQLQLQLQSLFHASTIEITAVKDNPVP